LITFLYRKLKKFESHRLEVVYDLLSGGERFLDIGCGGGSLVFMAKDKFNDLYGIDISSTEIHKANNELKNISRQDGGKIRFLQYNVEDGLPFNDDFFDTVTCIAVLQYIKDVLKLLDEIRRVISPGGEFIVQVPNIAWFPNRLDFLFGKLPITGYIDDLGLDWWNLHYFTMLTLKKILLKKGFKITQIKASGIFAKQRRVWPTLLYGDFIIRSIKA